MDTIAKVYITKDYSVELYDDDIESIAADVREALYNMPRPADYSVSDILTQADIYAGAHIEVCMGDLDNKQRTKEDYWHVIKLVLEQIEVIAK